MDYKWDYPEVIYKDILTLKQRVTLEIAKALLIDRDFDRKTQDIDEWIKDIKVLRDKLLEIMDE